MRENIGIFWCYNGIILAKKSLTLDVKVNSCGNRDTSFEHINEWETKRIYLPNFPELIGSEYQEIPRGRIIFSETSKTYTVFADKTCLNNRIKQAIKNEFNLNDCKVRFKSDPHYQVFHGIDVF